MKKFSYGIALLMTVGLTACSTTDHNQGNSTASSTVQTENKNKAAFDKATSLTAGWPEASTLAAREIIVKHGDPQETTSETLIWRNIAPFKRIIVHKTTYQHKFPFLHQNAVEHVVDYRAPASKVQSVWNYNGSIVLDRTKGEMSAFGDNESQNILALNLAHDVLTGKRGTDNARVTYGKEMLSYMNGNMTAMTQVLSFGGQYQTQDPGTSIENKIRWQGLPSRTPATNQNLNLRQAQEEKKR